MLLVVETPFILLPVTALAVAVAITAMVVLVTFASGLLRDGWNLLPAVRGGAVLIFGLVLLTAALSGILLALWFAFSIAETILR